jgi:hypothetical protein
MRDQLISHDQLSFDGAKYSLLDVTTLGLTFADLHATPDEIEAIVNLVTLFFRNTSFDFERLNAQLTSERDTFWAPAS